jgi:hypothetical protein
MHFFPILFILIVLFAFIHSKAKRPLLIVISKYITFLLLFLPPALQYNFGTDYPSYIRIYNQIGERWLVSSNEWGYYGLNKLLYSLHCDPQWFFVVMSFLTILLLFMSTSRKSFYLIIILYFVNVYFQNFNLVRQALVVVMAFYTFNLFNEKKYVKSFIWIICASLFHFSAFIYLLPLILMLLINLRKKDIVILSIIIMFFGLFSTDIIKLLYNTVVKYTKYSRYINDAIANIAREKNTGLGILLRYVIVFFFLVTSPDVKNKQSSNMYILILCYLLADILGNSIEIFLRIQYAFSFVWLMIACYITSIEYKYKLVTMQILYIWCIVIFYPNISKLPEYMTIFNK